MKNYTLLLLLFIGPVSFGQQVAFQPFEVDSAAEPRGGMAFLNTFIVANLHKPTTAEAKGMGGRVIVSGVIEPDGHVTETKIIRSLRPDCDREVLRVFGLFNAWKPAQKGGQPVRQLVSIPITYPVNAPFSYVDGAKVTYFGEDMKSVPDSSTLAQYKQVAPMDSMGLPTGDLLLLERKGKDWQETVRLPVTHRKDPRRGLKGQFAFMVGYLSADKQWQGPVVSIDAENRLVRRGYYENGRPTGSEFTYYPNGLVAERREEIDKKYSMTSWYDNGQIKQIWTVDANMPLEMSNPDQITAFWDYSGRQFVKAGNGHVSYLETVNSYDDTTRTSRFHETGSYEQGLKQGVWRGYYADGSYQYDEVYDKGVCKSGKSLRVGSDTLRYTVRNKQPEFIGGLPALSRFLSGNLMYPPRALQAKVEGQVLISFVVDTDGDVEDVTILKGMGFGCDEEAKRVVNRTRGKWTPAMQRGQPVRVKFNLPINFSVH